MRESKAMRAAFCAMGVLFFGLASPRVSAQEADWSAWQADGGTAVQPQAQPAQPQAQPTEQFQPYQPVPAAVPVPPPAPVQPVTAPPMPGPSPVRASPYPVYTRRSRAPEPPNTTSMSGAPTLGQWNRGESASIGFPLISLRFLLGLADRFDLGVGFDSYYLVMNEPMLVGRLGLVRGSEWSLSMVVDAGASFFTVRANREDKGARWLTGRRNFNLSPALVLSYQGPHPRAARLFFEARYLLAFDTEPIVSSPLAGVPGSLILGHNVTVRGGAELPLSATTSFLFSLGLDFHGRAEDSLLMPEISVGVVTSL